MELQLSYFKSQKMMLFMCCTQYASKFEKTQQRPQDWKRSVFILIPKKGNAKECSNYCTIVLISHASKIMLIVLQTRFQQYMNQELAYVQAGFRKHRGTRDQIANIHWIMEKEMELQKPSTSASMTTFKPLRGSQQTGKFMKMDCQATSTAFWETCIR